LNFFKHYATKEKSSDMSLYKEYLLKYNQLLESVPEMPFSNLWMAQQISKSLPSGSRLHLGIRNSLRSYDYFNVPADVNVFCNTGGFGIDGGVSSLIGASMMHKDKLFYGVFGDLLFFYDMNSLGNRDINPNLRILVVNNGLGQEFKNYSCGASNFGEETDMYIAARGHFGKQSRELVKVYTEALGFKYLTASNKEEFEAASKEFLDPKIGGQPILFEAFTQTEDENAALKLITMISSKSKLMNKTKEVLQSDSMRGVKNFLKGLKK
jgi:2-succinyl-5-enolpyruvyl-6-hydroxy-3-cyclohexene-1-carboxylate synthase